MRASHPAIACMIHSRFLEACLVLCVAFAPAPTRADSPLTSTGFAGVYADVPEVAHALDAGKLDARLEAYLLDRRTPPDRAIAVINALGWNFDGQDNHLQLLRRLQREDPARFHAFRRGNGDGHLLLVIGYAWVMDDYLRGPEKGEALLRVAARRLPDSFAAAFAHVLARAQLDLHDGRDDGWCRVHRGPRALIDGWGAREVDLRQGAIDAAMEYLDGYGEYCR